MMDRGFAAIVIAKAFWKDCWTVPLSLTSIVKFELPAVVGVPAIVAPVRFSPAGSEPDTKDQV